MARIRSVKPEYWTSEQVMNMSRDARLLFIGLWNFCDDGGNHPASPKSLKAEVLPGDDLTADQVMAWVDEMIEQGLVEEYDAEGKTYWHVTGWKHQRIDQPTYRFPTGDTSDASDASDTRVTKSTKRLGGKQRQLVLKKLRDRDGDACHICGDSSNLSIFSKSPGNPENPHDITLLRLICSNCKRTHKTGDAKNGGCDAGDTKTIDGDSPTESSRVESKGEERKGDDSKPEAAHIASTVVGKGDAGSSASRVGEICVFLRRHGINTSPQHLSTHAWAANPEVTDELLTTAIAKAKKQKPNGDIHPNYLKPIIEDLLQPLAPLQGKPRDDWTWKKTKAGIEAKGREMGMFARGTESHDDFAVRIQAEIEKRRGAQA